MSKALQITSAGWLLISLGHTTSAKDWQANAKFQTLPRLSYACAKVGWYQGSGFFIMNGTSTTAPYNPALLRDPVQKAIAGAMIAIMWASGWWYSKNGAASNAVAVGAIGALQGYSAFTI
ncbi:hypothetical protein MAC_02097 [Metarhizium acridum CQMa 102]|uniref:Integral membrane protein n=1 Tax=Metarhizium acridum (strain CQMa 102) TaxID=655827 RepID=E9DWU9_METAQ|nr:uncharacterized protein MAC_02097 [Metarhizium acridum CQMa 102]EFY91812.1 hypothetical protein MAC_02097 [Metarhizium acridum CQMa 102]